MNEYSCASKIKAFSKFFCNLGISIRIIGSFIHIILLSSNKIENWSDFIVSIIDICVDTIISVLVIYLIYLCVYGFGLIVENIQEINNKTHYKDINNETEYPKSKFLHK